MVRPEPWKRITAGVVSAALTLAMTPAFALAETADDQQETPAATETAGVAKVGDTGYTTLAEAVKAAPADGSETVITLLGDATGSGVKVQNGQNVVFDLAGFTYSVDTQTVGSAGTESNGFQMLKGSKVTFKDGTVNLTEGNTACGILLQNYCDLTLDNVTIDASNGAYSGSNYAISNNFGSLTVKGASIIKARENDGVAFDLWYGMNGKGLYDDGVSVTFGEDFTGTVTGFVEYGAANRVTSSDWMSKAKLDINAPQGTFDVSFKTGNTSKPLTKDSNINITAGTFTEDLPDVLQERMGTQKSEAGNTYVEVNNGENVKVIKEAVDVATVAPAATSGLSKKDDKLVFTAVGSAALPDVSALTIGGRELKVGVDYEVVSHTIDWAKKLGTLVIKSLPASAYAITGTSTGGAMESASSAVTLAEHTITYTAEPATFSQVHVAALANETYNGKAHTPDVSVTVDGYKLVKDTDYELSYSSNINAGTVTVTITGINSYIGSSATATFTIDALTLTDADVADIAEQKLTEGKAVEPEVTVTVDGATLTKGSDYTVQYANNTKAGTASVTVTGTGNYTGTVTKQFKITAAAAEDTKADTTKTDTTKTEDTKTGDEAKPAAKVVMYRLYNPNSGEHFYTQNTYERNMLVDLGWKAEGIGWTAPKTSKTPVYRLYNPNAGDHHYTTSAYERDHLKSVGWNDEGIGWYSDDAKGVPLYRQYNPNAWSGTHNYTASKYENDYLVGIGWKSEGIGWYGVK